METIRGRRSRDLDFNELQEQLAGYRQAWIDLGTGDGRFVRSLAEQHTDSFFIGIDACRENLRVHSQRGLPNALFLIAPAQALPVELEGVAAQVTVNFPWGSLLESLLGGDPALLEGLSAISGPRSGLDVRLNGEALRTAGWTLEAGAGRVEDVLNAAGWQTRSRSVLDANALKSFASTWARRLAFGRDPRAVQLSFRKV